MPRCLGVQLGGSQIFNVTLPTITLDAKVYNPKVPTQPIHHTSPHFPWLIRLWLLWPSARLLTSFAP